jgi:hypothetical protein
MFRCGAQRLFQIGSQQILLLIFGAVTLCLIIKTSRRNTQWHSAASVESYTAYFMESCQQLMPLEKPRSVPRVAFSTVAGVNL